jgi:hypothetical protein
MSITALPPGTTEPPEGVTSYYICNLFEWTATMMEKGAPCWFSRKDGPWRKGTFKLAWMYDGIIADVIDEDGQRVGLLLDSTCGDRLITPEDHATLEQWEARPR